MSRLFQLGVPGPNLKQTAFETTERRRSREEEKTEGNENSIIKFVPRRGVSTPPPPRARTHLSPTQQPTSSPTLLVPSALMIRRMKNIPLPDKALRRVLSSWKKIIALPPSVKVVRSDGRRGCHLFAST